MRTDGPRPSTLRNGIFIQQSCEEDFERAAGAADIWEAVSSAPCSHERYASSSREGVEQRTMDFDYTISSLYPAEAEQQQFLKAQTDISERDLSDKDLSEKDPDMGALLSRLQGSISGRHIDILQAKV